jgi:acetyl-CoA carboxylase biotin carboxyl carrier protein
MSGFDINVGAVAALAGILEDKGLGEIEYKDGENSIRLSKAGPAAVAAAAVVPAPAPGAAAAAPMVPPAEAKTSDPLSAGAVTSPMVGTAYLQAGPGEPHFVKAGDRVKAGDVLLIIEAMKVMNQITATQSGVVLEINVENAQPVEFGELLMVVE